MFTSNYHYTTDALKQSIITIKNTPFLNLWSKEAIENIIYPSTENKTDVYLYASISTKS